MKVVQRKIIHDIGQSLSLARFPHLSYPVHRHDEYELVIMTSGTGREYIGQAVADYRAGDMTLIGRDISPSASVRYHDRPENREREYL